MSNWKTYNDGKTVGTKGNEGDTILQDEEHPKGARITLKRSDKYVSISCKINHWINHSRFFAAEQDAKREYELMKTSLVEIIDLSSKEEINKIKVWEAISNFVRRFP